MNSFEQNGRRREEDDPRDFPVERGGMSVGEGF